MTVKELKEILDEMPDVAEVVVEDYFYDHENITNVVHRKDGTVMITLS